LYTFQVTTFTIPFELMVKFESGSMTRPEDPLVGSVYENELITRYSHFVQQFDSVFPLAQHGYDSDHIHFARATLSNMIGSIGYFYGSSLVKSRYNQEPVEYWPAALLTAVPSRSFFPRGFLWDEGFHQLLVSRWNETISRDIIGHWLDLMNVEGWIPREQILGSEARARVPREFVVQFNENANPPALFLPMRRIIRNLIKNNDIKDRQFLRALYPRLRSWYSWFNRTQTGKLPTSYRWRGRNATTVFELNPKTLTSGLDDYPRASHPTDDERHVDLRCWMAFASGVMADLAEALNESTARVYRQAHATLNDNRLLDELHWSDKQQRYSDYGLHTDGIVLKRPKPVKQQPGPQLSARQKERVVKRNPQLGFVDTSFGYVNLFPFLLRVLEPQSPRLTQILSDLRKPELLWTPYGLRSLSPNSPLYAKYNTEHDPPYWRGTIWININYLALAALQHYATAAGGTQNGDQAADIYQELRKNVVENIYTQYRTTGYVWEQYNDTTGIGRGSHPFTGWTALVVSIMAEDYF
jgi:mannosyl-oligosaccharide glucosidase